MKMPTKLANRQIRPSVSLVRTAPVQLMLLNVERVAADLAKCVSVDEVVNIADRAAAVLVYQRRRKAGESMAQDAGEILVRAERRLGELLASAPKSRGGRGKRNPPLDGEVSPRHAEKARAVAAIPAERFDAAIADARKAGKIPTPGGVRAAVKPRAVETTAEPVRDPKTAAKHRNYRSILGELVEVAQSLGLNAGEVGRDAYDAAVAHGLPK